jgi:hypothetical protein
MTKILKSLHLKKIYFILIKNCYLLIPRLLKGRKYRKIRWVGKVAIFKQYYETVAIKVLFSF